MILVIKCPDCYARIGSVDWSIDIKAIATEMGYAVRDHGLCSALAQSQVLKIAQQLATATLMEVQE